MANTIQIKRGLESARTGITPAAGELIYVTDTNKVYVGDGSTAGGIEVGSGSTTLVNDITPTLGGDLNTAGFDVQVTGGSQIVVGSPTTLSGPPAIGLSSNVDSGTYSATVGNPVCYKDHVTNNYCVTDASNASATEFWTVGILAEAGGVAGSPNYDMVYAGHVVYDNSTHGDLTVGAPIYLGVPGVTQGITQVPNTNTGEWNQVLGIACAVGEWQLQIQTPTKVT